MDGIEPWRPRKPRVVDNGMRAWRPLLVVVEVALYGSNITRRDLKERERFDLVEKHFLGCFLKSKVEIEKQIQVWGVLNHMSLPYRLTRVDYLSTIGELFGIAVYGVRTQ